MKMTTKILGIASIILLASTLVGATLLTQFGTVETTMNVQQALTIDGNDWNVPVTETIDATGGTTCYSIIHTLSNAGDSDIAITWTYSGSPDLVGITIQALDTGTGLPVTTVPAGSSVYFVFEYILDPLIVPGTYTVIATLVPT
jgi:hypothetical protein